MGTEKEEWTWRSGLRAQHSLLHPTGPHKHTRYTGVWAELRSIKIEIPSNRPCPPAPTIPEPSQFSDEETEAQRGTAAGPGSHSILEQSETPNPGSPGQGLGSLQNAHGHLLPTQQECPGLNTHLLRRSSRQTEPSIKPPRNAGSCVIIPHPHAQTPRAQSLVQRAQAGTLQTKLFSPV